MNDTSPEMERKMNEMIQMKTPFERFTMGCSMYQTSKFLVTRSIRENNPNISDVDLRRELFLKFYEDDFTPDERAKILRHFELLGTCDERMSEENDMDVD